LLCGNAAQKSFIFSNYRQIFSAIFAGFLAGRKARGALILLGFRN
jgi:hypothetical protein